ncbi:hypothetical protein HNP84_002485 [Thermocatellispora tengchongensis]|uniref:Uncharacterized protein n=2 Tax=Thermocatellispora tengchongensis TaxID=1073253 RepID=A0A840NVF4_9ACTN|nr:hypothetical protein [Thermocatellispora tengchongensis]MBB5132764.1 hypothetical protein [Thermocatellispora tengchongensis]
MSGLTATDQPLTADDVLTAKDGQYIVLQVREEGRLIKARHITTNSIWHLVPHAGTWARL